MVECVSRKGAKPQRRKEGADDDLESRECRNSRGGELFHAYFSGVIGVTGARVLDAADGAEWTGWEGWTGWTGWTGCE